MAAPDDGVFGEGTDRAVRQFQRDGGLGPTGEVANTFNLYNDTIFALWLDDQGRAHSENIRRVATQVD
jgi:peptidoglycan hydrolase-like protein with peptidoglycan-binding domain